MSGWGASWGFLGIPGIKEMVLVAVVTLVLYGRSGLFQSRHLRVLRPWIAPSARRPPPAAPVNTTPATRMGDRLFWVLAITAATAVAALIVTRVLILSASGPSR